MSYPADRAPTQTVVSAVGYTDSANVSAAHKVLDGLLRQQSRQLSTEVSFSTPPSWSSAPSRRTALTTVIAPLPSHRIASPRLALHSD